MLPLRCAAQNYEWGRLANDSEVAQLARANGNNVDESKPFAELWMGAHPNCPSRLAGGGQDLQSFLTQHPQLLGSKAREAFGSGLPFLFKVLSVRKALSIQSHPHKELAEQLHARAPKLYPDPNHKPEMALALSGFEALCGFVTLPELQAYLLAVPELARCVGKEHTLALLEATAPDAKVLRAAFTSLMTCDPAVVSESISTLTARLRDERATPAASNGCPAQAPAQPQTEAGSSCCAAAIGSAATTNGHDCGRCRGDGRCGSGHCAAATNGASFSSSSSLPSSSSSSLPLPPERAELVLRLDEQYPGGDVGVLSSFFLNLLRLPPCSAIYLPPNEPHAYLAGELVECMAASDNVIRAGLTPKFKDVEVLCASLTYRQGMPEVLTGTPAGSGIHVYRPPFEEFEIHRLQLEQGAGLDLPASQGPRLVLVQQGGAQAELVGQLPQELVAIPELQHHLTLERGSVVLLPAGVPLRLGAADASDSGMVAWVAAVNSIFFELQDARRSAAARTCSEQPALPAAAAEAEADGVVVSLAV